VACSYPSFGARWGDLGFWISELGFKI